MNVIKQFDRVLDYIEKNLLAEISPDEIVRLAGCSGYSFQRMFSYIVGIPLSEYIRNRKMSNAGFELMESDHKIIDLALKYGYSSPTAFNRAFQSVHGFPPSKVKEKSLELVVYPRIRLNISVSGDESIKYRIEQKEEMQFYGKSYLLSSDIESNFQNAPLFWDNFTAGNEIDKLLSYAQCRKDFIFGITTYEEHAISRYLIGLLTTSEIKDKTYEQITVPGQTWLILSDQGRLPDAVIRMYRTFYREWLPVSNYEYDFNADMEVYPVYLEETNECELWLPIRRKKENI
ncbi:MAG: AraC family transcriptional regulator [Lachnospiraceae bacterium]